MITAPLGQGKLSFGTEETFTERHDIFKQSGFSNDADNRIKQSIASVFADYSIELGQFNLTAGLRYEYQKRIITNQISIKKRKVLLIMT